MARRTIGVVWSKSTCPFFIGRRNIPKPNADVLHLRIIVEDFFRQLFPRHLPFSFLRNDFRAAHRSHGCGKKSAFDKIPSVHILFYFSTPINHAGLRRTSRSMSLWETPADCNFKIQSLIPSTGCGITACPKSVEIKLRVGSMRMNEANSSMLCRWYWGIFVPSPQRQGR